MSNPTYKMIVAIGQMSRDEMKLLDDCIKARCLHLRREHPFVYGVKRTLKDGSVRYHTRATQYEPGWGQTCATDLQHKRLFLHTRYEEAEETAIAMRKAAPDWRGDLLSVFSIAKAEFVKLPCFEGYREIPSFQPLGDDDE
jgi:hypothetical protein